MMHFLQSVPESTVEIVNQQLEKIRDLEDKNFSIISPSTLGDSLKGKSIQEKKYV